jgi:hypothetical protein
MWSPFSAQYATVCSLPAEYCEYGPDFEKCKPWLIKNAPELYPQLVQGKTSERMITHSFFHFGTLLLVCYCGRFCMLLVKRLSCHNVLLLHNFRFYRGSQRRLTRRQRICKAWRFPKELRVQVCYQQDLTRPSAF